MKWTLKGRRLFLKSNIARNRKKKPKSKEKLRLKLSQNKSSPKTIKKNRRLKMIRRKIRFYPWKI
jgi:hypothetical protein